MDILAELRDDITSFHDAGIEYALCCGLAMAVYALPRATLDMVPLIRPEDVDKAAATVAQLGYRQNPAPMLFRGGGVRIIRFDKIDDAMPDLVTVDLWHAARDASPAWEHRRVVEWDGIPLSVVSPRGLIQ
jgi:hypothetical protein